MTNRSLLVLLFIGITILAGLIYVAFFSKWLVNDNPQSGLSSISYDQTTKEGKVEKIDSTFIEKETTSEEQEIEIDKDFEKIGTNKIDCVDFNCFIAAAQDCQPASFINSVALDLFDTGIVYKSTSYYEIKGGSRDSCDFYMRADKIETIFPEGTDISVIEEANKDNQLMEGKDGHCEFEASNLASMLSRWKDEKYSSETECSLPEDYNCGTTCYGNDGDCINTCDEEIAWECRITGGDFVGANCSGEMFGIKDDNINGQNKDETQGANIISCNGFVDRSEIGGNNLTAGTAYGFFEVENDGSFIGSMSADSAQLSMVMEGDNLRATAIFLPSCQEDWIFDSLSTAKASIFITPGILSTDYQEAKSRLAMIDQLACFSDLHLFLQSRLSSKSLNNITQDAEYESLLSECVIEMFNKIQGL